MNAPLPPHAALTLPASGPVDLLFLLMHGAGADGQQMQGLAQALTAAYPQAAVVCLDAPLALPSEAVRGFRWYEEAPGAAPELAALAAIPPLLETVRRWQAHFHLEWPRVALAGFSQGGTLALEAVMSTPQLAGRVLSFGAAPLARPRQAPEGVCLHLLHGLQDEVVPYRHVVDAAQTWVALGADITADVVPGVGHALDERLITKALHQLRTFIPARLWREAAVTAAEMDQADQEALGRGKPH
ncbi:dienelactone hydrolase family protein [Inhella gelatinilytica]|uniref:Dienelactone hydrolase family protein n=1 Tax=Inhella gelatinilytica TaxID=2795030 RepID=A0A931ISW2_9BURK|nr:dienelactone hydrolase family protein [Inhella gelatinilytica]MBH9551529.1 dienelactone hydrolase family protein [Inhella gelatinilytica]